MVYFIKTAMDYKSGSTTWSETTKIRKVQKNTNRIFPTDNDYYPLGPFPEIVFERLAAHWVLMRHLGDKLPIALNSIGSDHFTGLQLLAPEVADVFCAHADGQYERVVPPKLWSLHFDREVTEPYAQVNVYRNFVTIDVESPALRKVTNPKYKIKYGMTPDPNRLKLDRSLGDVTGVWRDTNNSNWFCDDTFREAIEAAAPGAYSFLEIFA